MKKTRLITFNLVAWPIAVFLIFFNQYAVGSYYRLINGNTFQLNSTVYKVSGPTFIIGPTHSGNIGLGFLQSNEIATLYLKNGTLEEVEALEVTFSKDLDAINVSHCKFLRNKTNPNLPYLTWANNQLDIYFTITDKPDFEIEFTELCRIVSK